MIESELISIKLFLVKVTLKIGQETYKIKDLNGEKIQERFYEKELLMIIL